MCLTRDVRVTIIQDEGYWRICIEVAYLMSGGGREGGTLPRIYDERVEGGILFKE